MRVISAPEPIDWRNWSGMPSVFLAGSIEMGLAEEWQDRVIDQLKDLNVVVLNPRRKDWDSSWKQSIEDDNFREQVEWEQDGLLKFSDYILFYFAPDTKAPITLMELGLSLPQLYNNTLKDVFVCCPEGFWRKGNVDIACNRYNIPVYTSLDETVSSLRIAINDRTTRQS